MFQETLPSASSSESAFIYLFIAGTIGTCLYWCICCLYSRDYRRVMHRNGVCAVSNGAQCPVPSRQALCQCSHGTSLSESAFAEHPVDIQCCQLECGQNSRQMPGPATSVLQVRGGGIKKMKRLVHGQGHTPMNGLG